MAFCLEPPCRPHCTIMPNPCMTNVSMLGRGNLCMHGLRRATGRRDCLFKLKGRINLIRLVFDPLLSCLPALIPKFFVAFYNPRPVVVSPEVLYHHPPITSEDGSICKPLCSLSFRFATAVIWYDIRQPRGGKAMSRDFPRTPLVGYFIGIPL
jgi:hypothetical protein